MPKYLTKEEVEKEFDEDFGSKDGQDYFDNIRISSVKSFIRSLRLADKQALEEKIIKFKRRILVKNRLTSIY